MTWETRGGSTKYFYLSRRLADGRVRKQYCGKEKCPAAEIESIRLEKKAEARRLINAERQQSASAEAVTKEHLRNTTDITHALMLSVGMTNERYRGWRRLPMIAPSEAYSEPAEPEASEPQVSFTELVKAARQGDRSVIPTLRRMMRDNPQLARNNGDLASQTQIHWLDLIAGKDLYRRECLLMKLAELKRELLADTNGTVVEQMLVDQAISTWMQLNYHEDREATKPAENIQLGEFRLKKIESAYNRHMRALNALAAMKKIDFTKRMTETLEAMTSDQRAEGRPHQRDGQVDVGINRISGAFTRGPELMPMS